MLRIPGFVSEVMDLCLDTAPYPNHVMAFCGALTDSYLVFQAATSGDYFIGVSGEASDSSGGYWAPNGVKDQHSHETLLSLIEDLRKLAASQEERSEYVEVLKKHAAVAAGRR
jgi:hypothetical protein